MRAWSNYFGDVTWRSSRKESKPLRSHARTAPAAGGGRVKTQPKAAAKTSDNNPTRRGDGACLSTASVAETPQSLHLLIYTELELVVTGRWDA